MANGPFSEPEPEPVVQNRPLSLPEQPHLDPLDFQPLDPRLLRARTVITLGSGLLLAIIGLVVVTLLDSNRWIGGIAVAVIVVLTAIDLVATRVSFRSWGYVVRDRDLTVRHGVINRSVTSVSFNRVQHAAVNSGPIERWLGLATLKVFTAGSIGADVSIEGLPAEDAAKLQNLVLENVARAGQSTAVLERD